MKIRVWKFLFYINMKSFQPKTPVLILLAQDQKNLFQDESWKNHFCWIRWETWLNTNIICSLFTKNRAVIYKRYEEWAQLYQNPFPWSFIEIGLNFAKTTSMIISLIYPELYSIMPFYFCEGIKSSQLCSYLWRSGKPQEIENGFCRIKQSKIAL